MVIFKYKNNNNDNDDVGEDADKNNNNIDYNRKEMNKYKQGNWQWNISDKQINAQVQQRKKARAIPPAAGRPSEYCSFFRLMKINARRSQAEEVVKRRSFEVTVPGGRLHARPPGNDAVCNAVEFPVAVLLLPSRLHLLHKSLDIYTEDPCVFKLFIVTEGLFKHWSRRGNLL